MRAKARLKARLRDLALHLAVRPYMMVADKTLVGDVIALLDDMLEGKFSDVDVAALRGRLRLAVRQDRAVQARDCDRWERSLTEENLAEENLVANDNGARGARRAA